MIVDGRQIAENIYLQVRSEVEQMEDKPCLTVFTCAPNFETQKYLNLKKKKASEVGINLNLIEFPPEVSTEEVVDSVKALSTKSKGMIVQLPFPATVDIDKVLASIPSEIDVDAVHYSVDETELLPPVVGAIKAIADEHNVSFGGKQVVVMGAGRLVGKPAALWAAGQGATVNTFTKDNTTIDSVLQSADIIISGAGVPGLITPNKIKEGVIIFDAGTSEEGGELKGDADPSCAEKASLFTPVPGGIGPITVAILLKNTVVLAK